MKEQYFEAGERVLKPHELNKSILILWEGKVQVRVERRDPETGLEKDFWLGNLNKGACFNVYNSF